MIYSVISFGPANEFAATYTDVVADLPAGLGAFIGILQIPILISFDQKHR